VLKKVGQVAYTLDLPAEAHIHHAFHVSQLKKKLGANVQAQCQIPTGLMEQIHTPEAILTRRMANKGGHAIKKVLIKWHNLPVEESSWESYWSMAKRFPNFDLEARSNSRGMY